METSGFPLFGATSAGSRSTAGFAHPAVEQRQTTESRYPPPYGTTHSPSTSSRSSALMRIT